MPVLENIYSFTRLFAECQQSSVGLRYLENPDTFEFSEGYVDRPTGDGLGIEVDEEYVRERATVDVNWQNPIWHHDDGSIAEW